MDKDILGTPDDSGWHFFKKNKKARPCVVYINDDGVAFAMDEDGDTFTLDNLIGKWQAIEMEAE